MKVVQCSVSIIVIHWNTPGLLLKQIESWPQQKNREIIIVDNASDAESQQVLQSILKMKRKDVKIIFNKRNEGFAAACNTGAAAAQYDWLLFMNPDIQIQAEEIGRFVREAENRSLDAASYTSSVDRYSKPLPGTLSLFAEFTPLGKIIPRSLFKSFTLVGGFLLIKKSVLEKLNGWDERFFLWFEDSDLTKRLIDNEFKIALINANLSHTGGASITKLDGKKQRKLFFTSMGTYADKHFSFIGKMAVRLIQFRFIMNT